MAIKAVYGYLKKKGYIDDYNIPLNISFAYDEILEDLKDIAEENGIKSDYTIRLYIEDMQGVPAFMDFDVLECDFRNSRHVDVTLEDAIMVLELQDSIIDQEEKMDSRTRANLRYQKKNIKQMKLDLNRNTDSDIIDFLDQCKNKQGYIKKLIREDMKKTGGTYYEKK